MLFAAALAFIFDPENLLGEKGILPRLMDHLLYTGLSLGAALLVGIPIGLLIGHTGKGKNFVIALTGSFRALPTFGLLLFIILFTGLGLGPLVFVLAILAIPPIIAGAYSGLDSVNRETIDAARAIGMTEWQILGKVEIPLALPLILGGVRSATLQIIATATIAGYVGLTGLGRFLIEGLALHDYTLAFAGAILVAALALVADGILALIQRLVVPHGVSRGMARTTTRSSRRTAPSALTGAPLTEG
ncbi:MAG TPA: ABC transporter permease [Terrimesophilobacter sp.]|nr:ABC transporter permease [Terrimesophilobacter sp.]